MNEGQVGAKLEGSEVMRAAAVSLWIGCLALSLAARPSDAASDDPTVSDQRARKAFFESIAALCGRKLEGATKFPQTADHPLAGKPLVIHIATCRDREIRIPFQVGDDRSRTWILSFDGKGLLLKHDHRHADGTPDAVTMYGGWAAGGGTATRQRFPADAETRKMLPGAATNVWTLEIDTERGELTYDLERHGQPRYRALFRLSIETPAICSSRLPANPFRGNFEASELSLGSHRFRRI